MSFFRQIIRWMTEPMTINPPKNWTTIEIAAVSARRPEKNMPTAIEVQTLVSEVPTIRPRISSGFLCKYVLYVTTVIPSNRPLNNKKIRAEKRFCHEREMPKNNPIKRMANPTTISGGAVRINFLRDKYRDPIISPTPKQANINA